MSRAPSRVITEELGGSALSLAAQHGRLPAGVFAPWPGDREEWMAHAQRVRRENAEWHDAIRDAVNGVAATPAADRLRKTATARGIVVTTGQQASLFGGPVYTLAKALSALALADELEKQLAIPVAPVFWAATDDADFLEASRTWVADADGIAEIALTLRPEAGTPMSVAPLGDVRPLLAALRKASGSAAHSQYLEAAEAAYTQERTIGGAYVRQLRALLEPLGISVLDSSHPAYLSAARGVLLDAATRAPDVAHAVAERSARIRELGFEPQVDDDRGLSLVAVVEKGVKRRLPIDKARTLGARGDSSPALGANVLLRPVVERAILPTAAYVAGPAELAYFAQSATVADTLGRERPIGVPRWSGTVIEPFTARALERLGVPYQALRDARALERHFAEQSLPAPVGKAWQALVETVKRSVGSVDAAVRDASLMPPTVIEGLLRSIEHRLSRTERRMLAASKRRDAQRQHDVAIASAALFPFGKRQERVLNFVPMLTRGGPELVDEMRAAAAASMRALVSAAAAASR